MVLFQSQLNSLLYWLVQWQLSRNGDPNSPVVLGPSCTGPQSGTAMLCPFPLLLAPSQPSHSNSSSGPCLTMLVIILLPGCEKTTLISVFWRSPLPATLGKMLQEADVEAQGSGAERRVLANSPWDSWAKRYLLFPLRAHKTRPSQSNLWGGPFSFCLSQQKTFCPSGSEQGFH